RAVGRAHHRGRLRRAGHRRPAHRRRRARGPRRRLALVARAAGGVLRLPARRGAGPHPRPRGRLTGPGARRPPGAATVPPATAKVEVGGATRSAQVTTLPALPLVLAGPILRRSHPERVHVWLATS